MIILEPTQLPKLNTHLPPGPNGVHIRSPAPAVHPDLTIRRPRSSLSTSASTLPDYETSQKAHVVVQDDDDEDDPSSPRQNSRRRFRRFPRFYPFSPFRRHAAPLSKPWRALLALYYTFLIYTLVGSIIVVPVLVWKTRSSNRQVKEYKEFLQSPPPTIDIPLYGSHKVSMALPGMGNSTFDCDVWVFRPPAKSDDRKQKQYYSATLNVSLPVSPVLHLSTTNGSQGSLAVALNPNRSETSIVLSGSLSTDTLSLLHNTTLCTTQTSNTTSIALTAPPSCSKQDPSYAVNLTLLLPSSAGSQIKEFATYAPGFAQKFEALAPDVTFTTVALEGSGAGAPIDFASIVAETIVVKTAYAPVSGTLNVTGALSIDTVFAPVDVNVSLANYAPCENPTSASLSTGNAPLRVNFILAAASLPPPYWPNFILKAQTFNAPLNMTLSHAPSTPGARTFLHGITAAGPLTLVADALFAGTFDLSTKAANAIVDHPTNHSTGKGRDYDYDKDGDIDDDDNDDDDVTSLKFDYQGPGRALGWTGLGARPSDDDQGCLELEASLDNVALELVQMRGVPGAVAWASDNLWG